MGEFDELFDQSRAKIWSSFDKWLQEGSGWRLQSVDKVFLKMCKYKPIDGSTYIKSPRRLASEIFYPTQNLVAIFFHKQRNRELGN